MAGRNLLQVPEGSAGPGREVRSECEGESGIERGTQRLWIR